MITYLFNTTFFRLAPLVYEHNYCEHNYEHNYFYSYNNFTVVLKFFFIFKGKHTLVDKI